MLLGSEFHLRSALSESSNSLSIASRSMTPRASPSTIHSTAESSPTDSTKTAHLPATLAASQTAQQPPDSREHELFVQARKRSSANRPCGSRARPCSRDVSRLACSASSAICHAPSLIPPTLYSPPSLFFPPSSRVNVDSSFVARRYSLNLTLLCAGKKKRSKPRLHQNVFASLAFLRFADFSC